MHALHKFGVPKEPGKHKFRASVCQRLVYDVLVNKNMPEEATEAQCVCCVWQSMTDIASSFTCNNVAHIQHSCTYHYIVNVADIQNSCTCNEIVHVVGTAQLQHAQ